MAERSPLDIFTGTAEALRARPSTPKTFASLDRTKLVRPEHYIASPELVAAVNTALFLGQPLLLTGEPGSGKTQLGYAVAQELGLSALLFTVKSDSRPRDLFYDYDALGRFEAGDAEGSRKVQGGAEGVLRFLRYRALGEAILRAHDPAAVAHLLTEDLRAAHISPARSVVIIDEIDKAPRDFPNSLLDEIDNMEFDVPELAVHLPREKKPRTPAFERGNPNRPIVFIVSNNENPLPEAFLRRCCYFDIQHDAESLKRIVGARIQEADVGSKLVTSALAAFTRLRAARLSKAPGVAELLNWILYLHQAEGLKPGDDISAHPQALGRSLAALIKEPDDVRLARRELKLDAARS